MAAQLPLAQAQGCLRVGPLEGRTRPADLRPEGRNPKPERRPKSEIRAWSDPMGYCSAGVAMDSGLRISDFFRSSVFGCRIWKGPDRP